MMKYTEYQAVFGFGCLVVSDRTAVVFARLLKILVSCPHGGKTVAALLEKLFDVLVDDPRHTHTGLSESCAGPLLKNSHVVAYRREQ
jgi:hypothetical protein